MKNIIKVFIFLILITGVIYPLGINFVGNLFFEKEVKGSLIIRDKRVYGSKLIAQEFKQDKYFHPRPSSVMYNPLNSGASNLGPISKKLKEQMMVGIANNLSDEMLFTSGSGLDPHISVNSALNQLDRVSKSRNFNSEQREKLANLVKKLTINNNPMFFGTSLINVLELNMKLDEGSI